MHRAKLDGTPEVAQFAKTLEEVIISTVEAGHMTKDLAALVGKQQAWQTTDEFMDTIAKNLSAKLA
jgi:isocitrate dehydrogenase